MRQPVPVAHWKLDGNTVDSVGGFDGQPANIEYTTGPDGSTPGAALFNGRDSLITVPDSKPLRLGTGNFSITAWVKCDVPMRGVFGDILGKFDSASRRGFNLNVTSTAD